MGNSKAHKFYAIYMLSPDYGEQGFVTYQGANSNRPGVISSGISMVSGGSITSNKMKLEQATPHAYKTKKKAIEAMEGLPAIGFYTLLEVYLTTDK